VPVAPNPDVVATASEYKGARPGVSVSSSSFPSVATADEFDRVIRDETAIAPGLARLSAELGLGALSQERFATGSRPVYAIGDAVLKLYAPFDRDAAARESAVLRVLDERLPIPTPRLRADGELDGWGYVLMDRLDGELLVTAWPRIDATDRERLASELGETLAVLHSVSDARLQPARVDWDAFLLEQSRTAAARQRARGLDERWIEQIEDFLEVTAGELAAAPAESLLHTEVMREHLLVAPSGGRFRFSGLFDFEPAMVGAAEYDFGATGLFFSCGDPALFARVLRAYGYAGDALGSGLERRLMAYTLLHRYSNLGWYLSRMPPPAGVTRLDELAALWWSAR